MSAQSAESLLQAGTARSRAADDIEEISA